MLNTAGPSNLARADEAEVFRLGWNDTGRTEGIDHKQTEPLTEVLRVADSPYLDRPITATDFITSQANDAHFNQIASLVGKMGFF